VRPAVNDRAMCAAAGVRKPPKNEPAGDVRGTCVALGYGDLSEEEGGYEGWRLVRGRAMAGVVGGIAIGFMNNQAGCSRSERTVAQA
jgi:hypothetical protein